MLIPLGTDALHPQQLGLRRTVSRGARRGQDRVGEGRGAPEVHSEFGVQEVIQERVQAAAHARQAEGNGVKLFDGQHGGAVYDKPLRDHQVEHKVDVVRGEAEQEKSRAAQDHPQGPPLLAAVGGLFVAFVCVAVGSEGLESAAHRGAGSGGVLPVLGLAVVEGPGYADGAVADADEREQESKQLAHADQADSQRDGDLPHGQVFEAAAVAGCGTGVWTARHAQRLGGGGGVMGEALDGVAALAAPHQNERQATDSDKHPHRHADEQVVATPPAAGGERLEEEPVSLHADAHLKQKGHESHGYF